MRGRRQRRKEGWGSKNEPWQRVGHRCGGREQVEGGVGQQRAGAGW